MKNSFKHLGISLLIFSLQILVSIVFNLYIGAGDESTYFIFIY